MTTPTVEEIAGEIWRCVKEDFEKRGVMLPPKWNGIGLAYSGYVRAGEIMRKALDARYEEGVKAERARIVEIMENLVDDDLCTYDHHGYCQTHGWMSSSTCPHKLGQNYLTTQSEDN